VPGFNGGDRVTIGLPEVQSDLIKSIHATGKPVILVLLNGSALAVNWESENIPAILEAWYPGQSGGAAIADVLFGDYNPSGKLPVTFYKSVNDLPDFGDYNMEGRTYRYFKGEPLYEFGHGLSFTSFKCKNFSVPETATTENGIAISVEIENTGKMDGEEVIQLYSSILDAEVPVAIRSLVGFKRIFIKKGETKIVSFNVEPGQLAVVNDEGQQVIEPHLIQFSVGGKQPDKESIKSETVVQQTLKLTGEIKVLSN
jgi:beta-glucosidase